MVRVVALGKQHCLRVAHEGVGDSVYLLLKPLSIDCKLMLQQFRRPLAALLLALVLTERPRGASRGLLAHVRAHAARKKHRPCEGGGWIRETALGRALAPRGSRHDLIHKIVDAAPDLGFHARGARRHLVREPARASRCWLRRSVDRERTGAAEKPDAHTALDPVEEVLLILSSRRPGLLIPRFAVRAIRTHQRRLAPIEARSVPDPQHRVGMHSARADDLDSIGLPIHGHSLLPLQGRAAAAHAVHQAQIVMGGRHLLAKRPVVQCRDGVARDNPHGLRLESRGLHDSSRREGVR